MLTDLSNTIFNFVGVFYDKNMDSGGAESMCLRCHPSHIACSHTPKIGKPA